MKNIFDTIKERLLGHESDLDLDREWAALNQRRAQKHQRGSRRRLASVLLLLLFVGSCGSYLWLKMRAVPATPVQNDMAQKPAAPVGSPVVTPVTSAPQPTPDAAATNAPKSIDSGNAPARNPTTKGISTPSTVQNNAFSPNIPERNNRVKTPVAAQNNKAANQVNNPPAIVQPIAVTAPTATSGNAVNTPDAATNQRNNAPAANETHTAAMATGTNTAPTANAAPTTTATPVSYTRTNDNISSLPGRGITAPVMAAAVAPVLPAPYLPLAQEPSTPIIRKHAPSKTFSIFAGGGWLGARQVFRVVDGESEPYAALRQSTETALPSFTFNAGVQRSLGKKGFVEASLHYNQWYERLNYTFEQPKNYTYSNVLLKVSRIDGFGSEVTYGDTVIAGTQTVRIVHYNQFASINLRLALGRQLVKMGRFAFSAGAGVDGSVWRSARGMVAAPDAAEGTLDLKEIYKNSFGLGISAVTRFEYWLHPKYALHLAPGAVWWLGNALNANGHLDARWQQMSITAGLTHRF